MEDSRVINPPGRVFGAASLMENMAITASGGDTTTVGGNLEYEFYKSYGLGIDANYKRPYLMDDPGYNGWGDLVFYLTDRKLYTDKANRFDISDRVNWIIPMSSRSQHSTLQSGFSGELTAIKGLGRWNIMYGMELGNYYYQYDTTDSTTQVVYNSPLVWGNKIAIGWNFARYWHWNLSGSIRNSYDYTGIIHEQNMVSTGLGWAVTRTVSFEGGIKSTASNTPGGSGGGDSSSDSVDPTAQGGALPNLFDASATSFYLGLRVKL